MLYIIPNWSSSVIILVLFVKYSDVGFRKTTWPNLAKELAGNFRNGDFWGPNTGLIALDGYARLTGFVPKKNRAGFTLPGESIFSAVIGAVTN